MTGAQIIVLATPVFLVLIAIELAIGWRRGRNTYRLGDALSSIGLGVMSQVIGAFTKLFAVVLYAFVHERLAVWQWPASSPWVWLGALVLYDFCYYWHHRFGHTVAVLWAAHVVHHQSEDYNLSTALRQTSTGWIFGWIFYLPMAVIGVPPVVFVTVALIDLLYQYWVHTQHIGRLGWFDRWFCSPSNHRVHHGINDRYLDKNFGGILIIWDRLFGTFADEDDREPCVYGTRAALRTWNPVAANLQVYRELWRTSRRTRRWRDKLRVWLAHPGWRPADVDARGPKEAFDVSARQRFDPPVERAKAGWAAALFVVVLGATSAFLWHAHALDPLAKAFGGIGIVGLLVAVAALTQPRARTVPKVEAAAA